MLTTLRTPGNIPEWCTDEAFVLEPPAANVATGWAPATRPAAPIMNWLQNLYGKWVRYFQKALLSNWEHVHITTNLGNVAAIIFHPDEGLWLASLETDYVAFSRDGYNFIVGSDFTSSNFGSGIAIDSSRFILCRDQGILYRVLGASLDDWTAITKATMGAPGAASILHLCTNYPSSDRAIAVDADGAVYFATSITATWHKPGSGSQPQSIPSGTITTAWIIKVDGTNWYLFLASANGAKLYLSDDNGLTWDTCGTGAYPFATSGDAASAIAYDTDNEILVIVGSKHGSSQHIAKIEFSTDAGITWTEANIDYAGRYDIKKSYLYCVYYCGNGMFVAAGYTIEAVAGGHPIYPPIVLVSSDGQNWRVAHVKVDNEDLTDYAIMKGFACNGNFLLMCSDEGIFTTDSNGEFISTTTPTLT